MVLGRRMKTHIIITDAAIEREMRDDIRSCLCIYESRRCWRKRGWWNLLRVTILHQQRPHRDNVLIRQPGIDTGKRTERQSPNPARERHRPLELFFLFSSSPTITTARVV